VQGCEFAEAEVQGLHAGSPGYVQQWMRRLITEMDAGDTFDEVGARGMRAFAVCEIT